MQGWLERLLAADGVRLSPEQGQALYAGLSEVAAMERHMRTLTTLRFQVQDHEIRAALTAYTLEGVWGVLFDGAQDQFTLARLHTFEMGALLQSEKIAGAVISWMLHRLGDFEGEPMAILIDELSFYLAHPQFREALVDWIKTARKKNWAVIGATQSIADVDLSDLAAVLSEAFPNRIFLPNDRATEHLPRLMYQAYGLGDAEIERLAAGRPRQDYYWSSRQGKRMFQLKLSGLERAVLAGNAVSERRHLQALGGEGDALLAHYLRRHGFESLAEAIEAPEPGPEEITVPSRMPRVTVA
jgi:type IV secretion system protein VirB4